LGMRFFVSWAGAIKGSGNVYGNSNISFGLPSGILHFIIPSQALE
jgi:hypothetical protein